MLPPPSFKTCINFFNLACICESVFFFLRMVFLEYMLKLPQVFYKHEKDRTISYQKNDLCYSCL